MSWLGKITGGAFGFLVGGPLGAAFGVALGHQLDQATFDLKAHQAGLSPEQAERLHRTYLSALFQTLGSVAKSDGRVSVSELAMAREIMTRMQLPPPDVEMAMRFFNEGKQPHFSLRHTLDELREVVGERPLLIRFFMAVLVEMALCEGRLTTAKGRLLLDICDGLGFSRYEFFGIRTRIEASRRFGRFGGAGHQNRARMHREDYGHQCEQRQYAPQRPLPDLGSLGEAYRILGISPSASESEIKRAYRRAISRNHPDKIAAQHLPASEVGKATEMTQKIQQAYDKICQYRSLRH
jgi:DnaJ like chaperone protein